jgi:hypothetical protein
MSEQDETTAAVPATDNNADAVIGSDEYEQNKNNAGTSESQQEAVTQQAQAQQDAYDNATAQQDEASSAQQTETE